VASQNKEDEFVKNCLDDIKTILRGRGSDLGILIYGEIEDQLGSKLSTNVRQYDTERLENGA